MWYNLKINLKFLKEFYIKKRNVIALAGVALLSAGILAACSGGSKSSSSSNGQKFSYVYETEPENLNYITSGKAATILTVVPSFFFN